MKSSPTKALIIACTASLVGGCTGAIEDASSAEGPKRAPASGSGMSPSGGSLPSPDTVLRRLTRTEYNNTIRDLLGDTAQVGNALDPDASVNGFDNNAEVLDLRVPAIDLYDEVASQAVDGAFGVAANRAKLLTGCNPVAAACAAKVVAAFARRAWRRPVEDREVTGLLTALDTAKAQGDSVEEGVKLALRMVLTSPHFLYKIERQPVEPDPAGGLHRLTPHELATRMSYLVWSSTPDDQLLSAADATGDASLSNEAAFAAQLQRLLGDKKADALVTNFAAQWLGTRDAASIAPDAKLFPQFYQNNGERDLRQGISDETLGLFREVMKQGRNVVDLLHADFTVVNDRLAKFYMLGLPTFTGTKMVMTEAASHRFGLLSHASVLLATSNADRTVPSRRGKWVLTRLLCTPPGNPPPNTPQLPADPTKVNLSANATIRQRLEKHKTMPACAGCHALVDPIGLGFENYDAVGRWRDAYKGGAPVEAGGALPDGTPFQGAEELSRLLKNDPRFTSCFTSTLFAYALGRAPKAEEDRAAVDRLAADFSSRGGRINDLLSLLATSQAFQLRGGSR